MPELRIARVSDFPEESARTVIASAAEEIALAIVRTGGALYALDNRCPHAGGPLGEGSIENGVLRCPWHERRFDLRTGACVDHAHTRSVRCHPLRIDGLDVLVELP